LIIIMQQMKMITLEQQIADVENNIMDCVDRINNCTDVKERDYLFQEKLLLRREKEQLRDKELLLLRAQQATGKRIMPSFTVAVTHIFVAVMSFIYIAYVVAVSHICSNCVIMSYDIYKL